MKAKDLREKIVKILESEKDIANFVKEKGKHQRVRKIDSYELFIDRSPEKITASFKNGQLVDMRVFYRDEEGKCYAIVTTRYEPYDKK